MPRAHRFPPCLPSPLPSQPSPCCSFSVLRRTLPLTCIPCSRPPAAEFYCCQCNFHSPRTPPAHPLIVPRGHFAPPTHNTLHPVSACVLCTCCSPVPSCAVALCGAPVPPCSSPCPPPSSILHPHQTSHDAPPPRALLAWHAPVTNQRPAARHAGSPARPGRHPGQVPGPCAPVPGPCAGRGGEPPAAALLPLPGHLLLLRRLPGGRGGGGLKTLGRPGATPGTAAWGCAIGSQACAGRPTAAPPPHSPAPPPHPRSLQEAHWRASHRWVCKEALPPAAEAAPAEAAPAEGPAKEQPAKKEG